MIIKNNQAQSAPLKSLLARKVLSVLLSSPVGDCVEQALVWLGHRYPYRLPARGTIVRKLAQRKAGPELIATLRNGAKINVPLVLDGVSLYFAGCLMGEEEKTTRLLERALRPGDMFLDIGAHLGFYTFLAAKACGPSGQVYAFEARADFVEHLRKSVLFNGYENWVTVEHAAVVDKHNDEVKFFCSVNQENTGISSVLPHPWLDVCVSAPTVSIDGYRPERGIGKINAVKIDIEGAEMMALRGMERTLMEATPGLLVVEVSGETQSFQNIAAGAPLHRHPNSAKPYEVASFLHKYDYEPWKILTNGRLGGIYAQADLQDMTRTMNVAFVSPSLKGTRADMFAP